MPDPIEAIKFRMEQLDYNQNDLADLIGQKSRASEILNRKRKLSLDMIRKLSATLGIPSEVLIQAY
jgi:HTH-type transcriptional regulator/antitoxin HigA